MRGKIAVLGMVLLTIAILIFGYWFLFVKSPVYQRFKLNRTAISRAFNPDALLPEAVGDFKRLSFDPVQDQADGSVSGSAIYADTDGKKIVLYITSDKAGNTPSTILQILYQPIVAQHPGNTPIFQADAPFPYAFFTATVESSDGKPGYVYSDFTWLNGDWVLKASTQETDTESLLQFVNIYLY